VVPVNVRRERNEMLGILSEKKRRHFYEQHLGQARPVLFEVHKNKNLMAGFTDNYIKVETPLQAECLNQILMVDLQKINREGIVEIRLGILA
jgi:threonylcarbamoyladenosine tRNA methylthiotransferase MtaB